MPTSYTRAPSPFWYIFYPNGNLQGGSFAVGAEITFYRNDQRDQKKDVYSDPAGLNPINNPIRLPDLGRLGASVYFADDELYYLEIKYPNGATESIDGFPNFGGGGGGGSVTVGIDPENQLLNGQYRFNLEGDIPSPLTADETAIAQYWVFKKNNTSGTDTIKFELFNLGDNSVDATPIYKLRYTCTGQGSGETEKDIKQRMADVRTFEQTPLYFSMPIYSDSSRTVEVSLVQHFGTGGSPSADVVTNIGSFNLPSGDITLIAAPFTPPSVSGKSRGTNGDDYIELRIRMPLNSTCDIWFTNVFINIGDKLLPYPRLTKEKEDSELLGAMIPEIGKDDYGKVITANRNRMYSLAFPVPVGTAIEYCGQSYTDDDDWAICQGKTVSVNQDNKRYSRLFSAIGHNWGRGQDAWIGVSNANKISIATTTTGSVATPSNGTPSPTFTISQYIASSVSRYYFKATIDNEATYEINITNGGNGLTIPISNAGLGALSVGTVQEGNPALPQISNALMRAGNAVVSGTYFTVYTNSTAGYTFWYEVNGAGAAPAVPNTTNVKIPVLGTETADEIALKTLAYMAGIQVDYITTVAASVIPSGSYISINTNARQYYIWFKVGGTGTDPKISGRIAVMVELASSDTAAQVATKLTARINGEFFQIPDRRGTFARGYDPTGTVDFDARIGSGVGSLQYGQIIRHKHGYSYDRFSELDSASGSGDANKWTLSTTISSQTSENVGANTGGYETRPLNVAVNYLIKL